LSIAADNRELGDGTHSQTSASVADISQPQHVRFPCEAVPFNEFAENDHLLYACFPSYFLLGRGLLQTGPVTVKATKHILFQYDAKFARCNRFIFFLFDQMQRHAAARSVAARIKSTPSSFAKCLLNGFQTCPF